MPGKGGAIAAQGSVALADNRQIDFTELAQRIREMQQELTLNDAAGVGPI
jgi:hypothetical protein